MQKLQSDYDEANSQNDRNFMVNPLYPRVDTTSNEQYEKNKKTILDEFQNAKHRLYEQRAEAKMANTPATSNPYEQRTRDQNGNLQNETLIAVNNDENVQTSPDSTDETTCLDDYCRVQQVLVRAIWAFLIGVVIGHVLVAIIKLCKKV